MLPLALQFGVPMETFWHLSVDEIENILDASTENKREKITLLFELADLIGNRVLKVFNGEEIKLVQPNDMHPELFENLEDEKDEETERKTRIGMMQANSRHEFAKKWNDILRQKHGIT